MAATATAEATTTPGAAPAGDPEGRILRALAAAIPGELAGALDKLIARQAGQLDFAATHRPHPRGFPGVIASVRGAARALRHARARREFVGRLVAGDAAATFLAPEGDPEGEAVEVLKGALSGPGSFAELVRAVDARLGQWGDEVGKLGAHPWPAGPSGEVAAVPAGVADHLRGPQGDPVATLEDALGRARRAAALGSRVGTLEAARGRLVEAFRAKAAAVAEAAGGVPGLAAAVREASALADASVAASREEGLRGLREDLAGVDAKLAKLGVDPAAPPEPAGRATRALLDERAELAARIEQLRGGSAKAEADSAASTVSAALGFDPGAWEAVRGLSLAEPSAFPASFAESWGALPLESLRAAGASSFVEPFEAS